MVIATSNQPLTIAGSPDVERLEADVARLSLRCRQHETTLARLADALGVLRTGNRALNEENRELHRELERLRHGRRTSR